MNQIQESIIRFILSSQHAPQDFIDGLIESLRTDIALGGEEAQTYLNGFMALAQTTPGDDPYAQVLRMLAAFNTLYLKEEAILSKKSLLSDIVSLCDARGSATFSERIVLSKLEGLLQKLKSDV